MRISKGVTLPHHFTARDYQIPYLSAIEQSILGNSEIRYFMQVWHRRSGKDKTNIADVVPRRLMQSPCLVKYIYPTLVMGRENLWEGIGGDGYKFMNHLPGKLRIGQANESRMTVKIKNNEYDPELVNHSIFQIAGSDRPDSLRGGNPKLVVYSEYAEQDPEAWNVVEPILKENNGIAVFNFTPKGDNHARSLYEYAKNNPLWYVQILTALDTGIFSVEQLEEIRTDIIKRFTADGRSEEEAVAYYEQEYMCSFISPVVGSYYGAAIRKAEQEKRIGRVPYERVLDVHTAWDLGVDDSTTIWFYQNVGAEIRFIDYYENTGEGIEFYIKHVKEKPYVYGKHYAPHDIQVRGYGTGKTRWEIAKGLGIRFEVAPKLPIEDGINATRGIFSQCWFDEDKCDRGIQCLKNYKKKWNDKMKVFSNTPDHNWASHGADAMRTFSTTFKRKVQGYQPRPAGYGGVKPLIAGTLG